jgi:phosphatidylglycerophosphate synthase
MIFQMFALECLLVHFTWQVPGTGLAADFHAAGMRFLWMALVLSVWSAIDYSVRVLRRVPLA